MPGLCLGGLRNNEDKIPDILKNAKIHSNKTVTKALTFKIIYTL
jgi:hypothetical protein